LLFLLFRRRFTAKVGQDNEFFEKFNIVSVKGVFLPVICLFYFASQAQKLEGLIPKPNKIIAGKGQFVFNAKTQVYDQKDLFAQEINSFNAHINAQYGFKLQSTKDPSGQNSIKISPLPAGDQVAGAYSINIGSNEISIQGDSAGVFYAFQTLKLLLGAQKKLPLILPNVYISDAPAYSWRGMHLDVCRHFFTKDEVKRYIDHLALYKFNVFHWHLTEDQGWRIEIKKYPKLTEIGSWRNGSQVGAYANKKFDKARYGGFYTQEDIKEIVAYAAQRHITIVPEIEMPGHSLAALAAYPQFSCTGGNFEVAKGWGVFEDVYCPKEETFSFLQDILDEVCALFPGKYIHIGGDECPKTKWKACANCQSIIKKENLKDEHELQSYFITRIEKYLNGKGKQIIGWDEILEGGLAPNAAVMSWRGTEGGIAAAKEKHYVVMSPGKPCYFDHYQSKNKMKEPLAIGGYNPLDSVYKYIPTPKELSHDEQKYIMGAQGNVWTEYITTFKQVEYMAVPRMCALAEVLWTKIENKSYPDFILRLKQHTFMLDKGKVNYAKHFLTK